MRLIQDRVFRAAAERTARLVFIPQYIREIYDILIKKGKIIISKKEKHDSKK